MNAEVLTGEITHVDKEVMRVDLNKNLVGLDGKDIPDTNLGKIVATAMANAVYGDSSKTMPIAEALYSGEVMDFDPEEYEILKNFVTNNTGFSNLVEYQILKAMK